MVVRILLLGLAVGLGFDVAGDAKDATWERPDASGIVAGLGPAVWLGEHAALHERVLIPGSDRCRSLALQRATAEPVHTIGGVADTGVAWPFLFASAAEGYEALLARNAAETVENATVAFLDEPRPAGPTAIALVENLSPADNPPPETECSEPEISPDSTLEPVLCELARALEAELAIAAFDELLAGIERAEADIENEPERIEIAAETPVEPAIAEDSTETRAADQPVIVESAEIATTPEHVVAQRPVTEVEPSQDEIDPALALNEANDGIDDEPAELMRDEPALVTEPEVIAAPTASVSTASEPPATGKLAAALRLTGQAFEAWADLLDARTNDVTRHAAAQRNAINR